MTVVCNLLVSSKGNWFMREVADLFARALTDAGAPSTVLVDRLPSPRAGTIDIIVAPHEFFPLGPTLTVDQRNQLLAHRAVLATEQPGSPWWALQRGYVEAAGLVLDVSALAVTAHGTEGTTALHAAIGYHPSLDRWGGDDDVERPIDLTFLGGATERRLTVLSSFAPLLSHRESRLLLHDPQVPVTRPGPYFLVGDDRRDLLATSKILLNIHREEGVAGEQSGYFEWFRAVDAFANGTVLLTEGSIDHHPLVASAHFVQSEANHLAGHATALLADDILRRKIAQGAYDFVRTELDMSKRLAASVVPALEDLADRSPFPASGGVGAGAGVENDATSDDAPFLATPVTPHRAQSPAPVAVPEDFESRSLAAIKQVMLGQIQIERRLSNLQSQVDRGVSTLVDERFTPGWATATPSVSVIIPLFNYAKTVVEAVDSVLASRGIQVEIVVVEDHSTDNSRQVIEQLMDDRPDAPIIALFRSSNGGLGAARNLGINRARTEHCFLLDADNLVYPDALRKLSGALHASQAAFAYSIIEVFGTELSLLSARPWDVGSLTRSPYIDAMSLIDRRVWREVGGFRENSTVLHGWEDYAFWLALAAGGHEGTWVPEPLCRYRRHAASMISTTRLDGLTPLLYLREEYSELDWP